MKLATIAGLLLTTSVANVLAQAATYHYENTFCKLLYKIRYFISEIPCEILNNAFGVLKSSLWGDCLMAYAGSYVNRFDYADSVDHKLCDNYKCW